MLEESTGMHSTRDNLLWRIAETDLSQMLWPMVKEASQGHQSQVSGLETYFFDRFGRKALEKAQSESLHPKESLAMMVRGLRTIFEYEAVLEASGKPDKAQLIEPLRGLVLQGNLPLGDIFGGIFNENYRHFVILTS